MGKPGEQNRLNELARPRERNDRINLKQTDSSPDGPDVRVVGTKDDGPNWPRALIFDANVYLDLAKTPGNAPVLRAIKEAVETGTPYRLLIPEPVMSAVSEHRDGAIEQHWKIRRDALRGMKSYLGDLASDIQAFATLTSDLDAAITAAHAALPDTVSAMDDLINAGTIVTCTSDHFAEAGRRFIQKRAPAHERPDKSRKHISIFKDCLIWAIVIEVSESNVFEFVTGDKDFVNPQQYEELHPELLADLKGKRFVFHTLADFVKKHIDEVNVVSPPTVWDDSVDLWGPYKSCPECGSTLIGQDLIPGPSRYGGWGYRQFCPAHGGYIDTGEPFDE